MTTPNTQEGNKLIAEFCDMICVLDKDCYPDHPNYRWEINGEEYDLLYKDSGLHWPFETPPHFDKDWRWLMPVVEKITKLKDDKSEWWFWYEISFCHCRIWGNGIYNGEIFKNNSGATIDATWESVTQFIHWYNSTSNPLTDKK